MLADLDAVPWRALRHALGPASDVPQLLRALTSHGAEQRQSALRELFARLLHQGTVCEASAEAVPFLFELLAEPSTPERQWLAFLLACLADGEGYLQRHAGGDGAQRFRELLAARGTTLEAELEEEARTVARVQHAVAAHADALLPYLKDSQSEIRAAVARALGRQAALAEQLLPALEAAEAVEAAPDARDALRLSVARLRSGSAT